MLRSKAHGGRPKVALNQVFRSVARPDPPAFVRWGDAFMKSVSARVAGVAAWSLLCLPMVAAAQGALGQKKGEGGTEVQGSAGPGGSQGDNGLEHCDKPMGA